MLLKPNYDVEESFKKTKPAYVGFFIAHSGPPFPPLNPLRTPFSTASTTITLEYIENSEYKIAHN